MSSGVTQDESYVQQALNSSRASLEVVSHTEGAKEWLQPELNTSKGTFQFYTLLQRYVEKVDFLNILTAARSSPQKSGTSADTRVIDQLRQEALPWTEGEERAEDDGELVDAPEAEPLQSYVIVMKEDVIEAIGMYVAAYLANVPEAANLQPAELQAALCRSLKELKRGPVRRLWDWGRFIYRTAAVSYSAFSMYENPWLVRAVVMALWTGSKVVAGLLL